MEIAAWGHKGGRWFYQVRRSREAPMHQDENGYEWFAETDLEDCT